MFKDLLSAGNHFFNSDLAQAHHELEVSHDELTQKNKVLTVALQELHAKQSVQATSLKSQIETRSADLLQIERRWCSLLEDVAVLRDRQNAIIDTMSMSRDITKRLEVDRFRGEFISVISHELRTPLTAIHGSLELLTGDLVSSESDRGKQLLHLAADSARQLVRLVNDILELE
ncbi:MAG: histidine kinase dimerization/phospho-acceptor domain-containing protein [Phormidesmis sp.]